jgi:hypothetical protein
MRLEGDLEVNRFNALFEMLIRSHELQVTDPRDRIYGLLGFSSVSDNFAFVPRYDIPVWEAFILFTIAVIKSTDNLFMLTTTDRESPDIQLPSWVPDWRQPPRTNLPHDVQVNDSLRFNVSLNIQPNDQLVKPSPSSELSLDGAHVDYVSEAFHLINLYRELEN